MEIPWSDEGIASRRLDFLAYSFGFSFSGHRTSNDCRALLEILQQPLPQSNTLAMQALLTSARKPDVKISALSSPFDSKDALKNRGYRWHPEEKVWAKRVSQSKLDAEADWLKAAVYGGKHFSLKLEVFTSSNRYSERPGRPEVRDY